MAEKFSIHDTPAVKKLLADNNMPAFRYAQIENAIYKNLIADFNDIQTISKDLRELLDANCYYSSMEVETLQTCKGNQTTKILFKTK
jgi:adenine C2-methylase RlmN of 23S rRNA A2503 and tRNA A37